jgi:polysaccharide pyruvyl transferase WcaK-like protein/glycosyltransferase involved in cell wall biosynthesis/MoaA/NifB/PqqE/SkfB family radical SAM enzyme
MKLSTTPSPAAGGDVAAILPKVINLQAVDICNSRCVMCNIWKDGKREMLSLDELRTFFAQPFFAEVTHVGVTGGEPTLRKDLLELYKMLPEVLPGFVGGSFITHGMQTNRAVEVYSQIHEYYRSRNLRFEGMVSLDGVGAVHDQVRGKKEAFANASRTLLELKARGVPAIAACTIVRRNVYGLHDLLDWGRSNGIYIRFRVAEFIRRLYNDSCAPEVRSFTPAEVRHLVSFFQLLLSGYEKEDKIRRTYQSILSLLTGGPRLIGCPYQHGGALNVDSRGGVASCAPKGEVFALPAGVAEAHAQLRTHRAEVMRSHCATCIHDYHDNWTPAALAEVTLGRQRQRELYESVDESWTTPEVPAAFLELGAMRDILLAGWYGTETAGDIAILQGIISEYLGRNPALKFRVLSLYPAYTRTTIDAWPRDLQARVTIMDYASEEAWRSTSECDAVVMAGGPLMDIQETGKILGLFKRFADLGKPRVIEGCGVGPLHRQDYRWNVCRLARLATSISVRDSASRDALRLMGIGKPVEVRLDPAVTFVRQQGLRHHGDDGKVIRCFLRELTGEYPQGITPAQSKEALTGLVRRLLEWYPDHRIELWAMHHFCVGGDDRVFAQQVVRAIGDARLSFDWTPRTPREVLEAMAAADFCVCMRFHSCVFAAEVGVPFLAIDYTAGGKIQGFLEDVGSEKRLCRLADLPALDQTKFEAKLSCAAPVVPDNVPAPTRVPVVLHVAESVSGGGGARAMIWLAREMRARGTTEHRLVALLPADVLGLKLAAAAGLEVIDAPSRTRLAALMAEADIVLVHWWNAPELAELFRRELPPVRLAYWLHVGGGHAPHVLTSELIDFADVAVACSPHTFDHPVFAGLAPAVRAQRAAMVLAGADFNRLEGLAPRAHAGFRVGYIGTLDPIKMHSDYVAMSCAVNVPDVKFVVCGTGDSRWLQGAAAQQGRAASFEFRGVVEDIRAVLEELDVYGYPLCPDTYAAAELNLQEAMYAGLPVVAFAHGGIPKLIRHGETGWLVHTAEEYARAIEFLHANPAERARLGANAAAFARQHWGAANAARDFEAVVNRMLAQPKRTRTWAPATDQGDLPRVLALNPGARLFVESLGSEAGAFRASLLPTSIEEATNAEMTIAAMPRLMYHACGVRYRRLFPRDAFLNLWAGLALLQGRPTEALVCFETAQRNGFTHWRVAWYRALAAEAAGRVTDAHAALQLLARAVPDFAPAREMLQRLSAAPPPVASPAEAAQQHINQAQRLLQAGRLVEGRESLLAALRLLPGHVLILELIADLDCRMGNFDSARTMCGEILRLDPKRATPRLQAVQAALRAASVVAV